MDRDDILKFLLLIELEFFGYVLFSLSFTLLISLPTKKWKGSVKVKSLGWIISVGVGAGRGDEVSRFPNLENIVL